MDYTQSIGNTNELQCMMAFIQLGYECSVPFGNGAKYDFIADINGELIRIQCKSSHYTSRHGKIITDSFSFDTTCSTTNTKRTIVYTYDSTQIDYFATCFEGKVYIIPVDECSTNKTLRFVPPQNGNTNYNKAEDYLITNFFQEGEHYKKSKEAYLNRLITSESKSTNQYTCPTCGNSVSKNGVLCEQCSRIASRKVERPSREVLKNLIRNTPFTEIGKQYGVTDTSVRKWCKYYNLPFRVGDIKKVSEENWQNI